MRVLRGGSRRRRAGGVVRPVDFLPLAPPKSYIRLMQRRRTRNQEPRGEEERVNEQHIPPSTISPLAPDS